MRAAVAALAVLVLLAGCGGGGSGQPSGSFKVSMTEFKFDPATMTVPSGKVVFYLVNGGTVSHDFVIRDSAGNNVQASELVSAGDTFVFTVSNLPAGTYTYFCNQTGHEAAGMKGTLTAT
ncbi:MAG TPA: cupredoxin domain-containing protein [Candidatus Dormibacteraeota bacterium]